MSLTKNVYLLQTCFFFLLGFTHEKKNRSVSHEEKKISPEIFMHMNFFPPQKIFPPPFQNNLLCFHRWKKNLRNSDHPRKTFSTSSQVTDTGEETI